MFKNKSLNQIGTYSTILAVVVVSFFVTIIFYGQSVYSHGNIENLIMQLFTMYLSIIIAVGLLSTFISSKLQKELNDALALIKNGVDSTANERKSFDIKEFQEIADGTYKMLETIKTNSDALKELNENLEQKVTQKTQTLEQKNQELESAKKNIELVVKAQDRFIKSAIHEINTPLAIIRANIELIELKGEKSKHLSKIGSAAKIIANIYDDLGYFVKKERYADKKIVIDFSSFITERIEHFMEIAHFSNLTLSADIDSGLFVYFDQLQLQRIIDNNIYNSIKYSTEQQDVKISLKKQDEKVQFKITNHSLKPINTESIFDRFYRGDNARGGFGIGLHLVHYICTKNGVDINVKNHENSEVSFEYSFEDFLSSVSRMQGF